MHLDLAESRANVEHVTKEVQQRWGPNYVIVTSDGLQLEDCEGTQGMCCVCNFRDILGDTYACKEVSAYTCIMIIVFLLKHCEVKRTTTHLYRVEILEVPSAQIVRSL